MNRCFYQAWRMAGGRIVEFCRGRSMVLLQEVRPVPGLTEDPFFNELPEDENDIVQRRVSDVVITPLNARAKREIQLEEREKINSESHLRNRRQIPFRGRFRGQTQSQYLNFGNGQSKEGKAEAKVTHDSSHAVVSEYSYFYPTKKKKNLRLNFLFQVESNVFLIDINRISR